MPFAARMNQADISIILPFFNEEESVRTVVDEIIGLYPQAEVVAVDDGSSDRTAEILDGIKGVKLVRFPKNRGSRPRCTSACGRRVGRFVY